MNAVQSVRELHSSLRSSDRCTLYFYCIKTCSIITHNTLNMPQEKLHLVRLVIVEPDGHEDPGFSLVLLRRMSAAPLVSLWCDAKVKGASIVDPVVE